VLRFTVVTTDNPAHPAATVLVLRDGAAGPEVFMVRRHEGTAFMAGAHVFPGGRVDDEDVGAVDSRWCAGLERARGQMRGLPAGVAAGYHVAAIRELFEEAGLLLARDREERFLSLSATAEQARFAQYRAAVHGGQLSLREVAEREGLRLALDALTLCAHWVTPPVDTRRFDTRFFLARMPAGQVAAHDDRETTAGCWLTAGGAIAAAERGEIVVPPPTWATLRELEPFASVDAAIAWAGGSRVLRREPKLVHEDGLKMLVMPGDRLHPEPPQEQVRFETRYVWRDGRWRAELGVGL
jgi:8-oxo-dGTP pyrophosphatase MutT (NUDIX family)